MDYALGAPVEFNCNVSGSYSYSPSTQDTVYLPMISNIPSAVDSVALPILTYFDPSVDGFYFPLIPLAAGSDDDFVLEAVDNFEFASVKSSPHLFERTTVIYGLERRGFGYYGGLNEMMSLSYRRRDTDQCNIVTELTDLNELLRYVVEIDGDLRRPVVVMNDLGSSFPELSDNDISFITTVGESPEDTLDIIVSATGGPFAWQAEVSNAWIVLDNYSGTTGQTLKVTVDHVGMPPGLYHEFVSIYNSDNDYRLDNVIDVSLLVYPDTAVVINVPIDYATIQEAVDAAVFGDTVLVSPGEYVENIDFLRKPIKVIGRDGPEATHLMPADSGYGFITVKMDSIIAPWAELSGFTFSGSDGNLSNVVHIESSDSVLITNNVFRDNYLNRGMFSGPVLIVAGSAIITWNLFHNNGSYSRCVNVEDSSYTEVRNNTFVDNVTGVWIDCDIASPVENNLFTGSSSGAVRGEFLQSDCNIFWDNHGNHISGAVAGPNDIVADPLYCCYSKGNFHIQPESPCFLDGGVCGDLIGAFETTLDCDCFDMTPFAVDIGFSPIDENGAVISTTPQILWTYFDTTTGAVQQAYEIQVGTDTLWDVAEMWLSGAVSSGDTEATYDGDPLADHATYFVRISLNNGIDWGDWTQGSFTTHYSTLINIPADQPTIQEGVNVALSGDTILVAPGTYDGTVVMPEQSIVLTSSGGAEVTTIVASIDS
jgi:hypothetical protein